MKFKPATGDLLGVAVSPRNMCVEWNECGRVVFSFAKRGLAISGHFSADRKGSRNIKAAINDFCEWAFYAFEWCTMMMAMIQKPSVERLVLKCGFTHLASSEESEIYVRLRQWVK